MIKSIEDDIDSVIIDEFYDGRRTPSYAVKLYNDSVQNHPTTESCLSRAQYISLTSKNSQSIRKPIFCKTMAWQIEQQPFVKNRAHRYLAVAELTTKEDTTHSLGKPTRSTLLKERMTLNYSKTSNGAISSDNRRRCCSALEIKNKNNFFNRNSSLEMEYGYLVGARYNAAHFLDLNSVRDKGLYVSKNNHNIVFTNSSGDNSADSEVVSPPNSPQSSHNDPSSVTNEILFEKTYLKKPRIQIKSNIPKTNNNFTEENERKLQSTMTSQRPHSTQNIQSHVRQNNLPIVIGSNIARSNFLKSCNRSPSSLNFSLTRTSVNLYFAKQNRLLRSRFHSDIINQSNNLVIDLLSSNTKHQECSSNSTTYLQCTKLYQKEN